MVNVKGLLIVLLVAFTFSACDILSNSDGNNFKVDVNNNIESLNERIQIINQPIVLDSSRSKASINSSSIELRLVANVNSPELNGDTLSATSIDIRANKIYISYHLYKDAYGGAVDIIDIPNQDEPNPTFVSQITIADTDINDINVEENNKLLWITGGRDVSSSAYSTDGHNGAIIGEFTIDNNEILGNSYRETPLPSYSGNDIVDAPGNNYLYVATGATGGGFYQLSKSKPDFNILNRKDTDFAKSIVKRGSDIVGLNLTDDHNANFMVMDSGLDNATNYTTPFKVHPVDGKNVLEHPENITYVALGNQGVKGFKFNSESDPDYEFNPKGTDASNGVTVSGKHVFIANGTDGLFITDKAKSPNKEPVKIYQWKRDNGSANFVKTRGNLVVLANGKDGVNILKIVRE
ncbi:hypothetical protein ACKGJO_11340 [Gracilimonas sp. Q87]|uniref:hypothetical protein n=1 Tax=Gracilimonas sp. Q87 TaxID=3384766 RepID=UPI003984607A